jgi:hypothetical protein
MKTSHQNFFLICVAATLASCAGAPHVTYESTIQRELMLEDLLRDGKFLEIFKQVEPNKFGSKYAFTPTPYYESDTRWVINKADEGVVPLMYLAAYKFNLTGEYPSAMKYYSKARVRGFLDAQSCKSTSSVFPWYNVLESTFSELAQTRQRDNIAYTKFANVALQQDQSERETTSPSWYCNSMQKDNILPRAEAIAARDKKIQELMLDNEKALSLGNSK